MTLLGKASQFSGGSLEVETVNVTTKNEWSGGNLIYVGQTSPGTATSTAKWAIRKLTYDGSNNLTDVQWASGTSAADKIWGNRASYSYS